DRCRSDDDNFQWIWDWRRPIRSGREMAEFDELMELLCKFRHGTGKTVGISWRWMRSIALSAFMLLQLQISAGRVGCLQPVSWRGIRLHRVLQSWRRPYYSVPEEVDFLLRDYKSIVRNAGTKLEEAGVEVQLYDEALYTIVVVTVVVGHLLRPLDIGSMDLYGEWIKEKLVQRMPLRLGVAFHRLLLLGFPDDFLQLNMTYLPLRVNICDFLKEFSFLRQYDEVVELWKCALQGGSVYISSSCNRLDVTRGWYYKACNQCRMKLQPVGKTFMCGDHGPATLPKHLMYILAANMADQTAEAKAIFFDDAATTLIGIGCKKMIDELGHTNPNTLLPPISIKRGTTKIFHMRFRRSNTLGNIDFVEDHIFEDMATQEEIAPEDMPAQEEIAQPLPSAPTKVMNLRSKDQSAELKKQKQSVDVPGLVVQDSKQEIKEGNVITGKHNETNMDGSRRETVGKDGDVGKKERLKISKYYIVAEKQCGDDGLGKKANRKRKLELNNKKGKKEMVDEANVNEKGVGEEGVVNKISQKRRVVEHNKKCNKYVVGEETSGVDKSGDEGWIHVWVSLWSLHRLIPNLSPQQRKNIIEMGFGSVLDFKIKDVPTRLSYWLLDNFNEETCVLNVDGKTIPITRETIKDLLGVPMGSVYVQARDEADFRHRLVIEWKSQFGKKERYYHGPLEQLIYTQTDGGWWFNINFLVLYLTSIGEANKNATCNLRFLHCINDETAIHQFDWCTFILECLIRTKKSWVRKSHYTGPIIILVILYASSMRTNTRKEKFGLPLINNWTAEMLNKLEEERCSMTNVEEVKKSVAAKLKKAGELLDETEYALDEALEQNPHDKELIQLRDLRDVVFGSRTYGKPASDSPNQNQEQVNEQYRTPEKDAANNWDFRQMDEAYPYTQVYGTPAAYVAYSEQFDLHLTEPPATTKCLTTPETLIGVRAVEDVSANANNIVGESGALTPYNICDAQPLQSIPPQAAPRRTKRNVRPSEVLRSPYVVREVYLCGALSNHEKRAADCLFSGRLTETDILFKTDSVNGPRGVLETLCPGILISSGVIDIFTKVLNHAELYRDPLKTMRRHEWDVKDSSAKEDDVKEAADKFNENILRILKTTSYRNLSNVDLVIFLLVFFPIIQGSHFFVVCMHLKCREVHILDNRSSLITDVSARYGDVVENLVARFLDFLAYQNHPAQGVMGNATRMILRLGCMTKKNFIDCGVFTMRHMETYMGGGEYDDRCELRRECKARKLQLDELRLKQLPLEERQRLEEVAFETVKARVTRML
ncbi:peptidase C48, SUMO/sentrin/Ubl1, partial [Tanacetum coccineum]